MGIRDYLQQSVDTKRRARLIDFTQELLQLSDLEAKLLPAGLAPGTNGSGSGMFPHFEPIRPNLLDHRRVNYIQNNLRLLVAQTRAIDVVPTWTNTDADIISEARRQWWEWRAKGLDGLGGWKQDIDGAFGDFAALGEGYLRAGMVEADSYSASTVIHYHPLNVMFDPYAKYPDESNWVVFSTVYGRIEAEAKFKNFDYEKYLSRQYQKTGIKLEGVRILEYFCKPGYEKKHASYIAFAEGLDGDIIEEDDNPFGIVPVGCFNGFIPSGSDVPVGMVAATAYIQDELERMDDDSRKKSQRDNLLGLDPSIFEKESLKAYADGLRPEFLKLDGDKLVTVENLSKHILTVPRNGENADQKERRQEMAMLMSMLAGIPVWNSGQSMSGGITATESNQIADRSAAQISHYSREFARGMQMFAPKVATIAEKFDTAPFCVADNNTPVWYNSGDERLTSATIFAGAKTCVIGDEMLIQTDVNAKQQREAAKWLGVFQISQAPKAWEQYLLALGIKNPDDYPLPAPAPAMGGDMQMMPQ